MKSFREFFREHDPSSLNFTISYIVGDQYTVGRHAYDPDDVEIPAKNPASVIQPQFVYDTDQLKSLLEKYKVEIVRIKYFYHEWGSFHERQLYCYAHLEIEEPNDIDDDLALKEELDDIKEDVYEFTLDEDNKRVITKTAPFTTFEDVLENWWNMARSSEIKTPTGSSEKYWNSKILATTMAHKKNYDGD